MTRGFDVRKGEEDFHLRHSQARCTYIFALAKKKYYRERIIHFE